MRARPLLAARVQASTPQEWFGKTLREIHSADYARWLACKRAADRVLSGMP